MSKLTRQDLMPLERYAEERMSFRARVIAHKKSRTVALGPSMTLLFEDRLTIQYQVQEMLRVERIFEAAAIQEELDSYNPLIPDANNLKATCLLEFPDPTERARELERLHGIEHRLWLEVSGHARVAARADEDMDRSNETKTSAVHFLRFELDDASAGALRAGAKFRLGIDDPRYAHAVDASDSLREALAKDLS